MSAATACAPPIEPSAATMRIALFSTASVPLTRSIATPRTCAREIRARRLHDDAVAADGRAHRAVHRSARARIGGERGELLQRTVVVPVEREETVRVRAAAGESSHRAVDANVGQPHVAERSAQPHAAGAQRVSSTRRSRPRIVPPTPNDDGVPPAARSASTTPAIGGSSGICTPGSAAGLRTSASRKPRVYSQPALCEIGRSSSKPPASSEPSAREKRNGPNSPTPCGVTANVPAPRVGADRRDRSAHAKRVARRLGEERDRAHVANPVRADRCTAARRRHRSRRARAARRRPRR